ncbi:hypothetical protein VN12_10105 [Pirellula sp. SH-Sr6A]|uniref:Lnb N-terminal periplasmic domain-containing protein n=1 Tax=Pirellula sp. SH-Sr6A TaxID=1632865 RepID=UPI00078EB854|nr:DUF4105 domain-containing protein [Pirellula sp. SH-Sr6A]AMV32467.1 hypothetical protein VN12_10105 [Pirellula sp. SH-Sr6A]
MNPFLWFFGGLVVATTTLWVSLAVHYHFRRPWMRFIASLIPWIIVGIAYFALPWFPWGLVVWAGLILAASLWFFALRPRVDLDWEVGMEILPQAEIQGDNLHVRNLRNSRYSETGSPTARYEERVYDLSKLNSIDYFLSHWSGPFMAHTMVSFGFSDGQYLCVSIEARRQKWQSYSPLWGLFRAYELMFIFGDERDLIWVRTNIRRENIYMYRLQLTPQHLNRLLLDYVHRLRSLRDKPKWYNSIYSNCTTNLFYEGNAKVPWSLKPMIFLNGLSAYALYQLGYIDGRLTFPELRSRSAIRERALAAGDIANISQTIRERT